MDLEQGRNFLSGLFDNYGIDINTWNGMPPDEQRDLATRWKKERETKGLSNNLEEELVLSQRASEMPDPVISDNATASNPSSLKGFLKKARLHDPQGAADLLNKENTPYKPGIQLGGDDEEPDTQTRGLSNLPHIRKRQLAEIKRKKEQRASQMAPKAGPVLSEKSHPLLVSQGRKLAQEEEENVGSAPRGGFSTTSALQNRLADYIKNKSGSAILKKQADATEDRAKRGDIPQSETLPQKIERVYDEINNTLSLENLSKFLQDSPALYAWLKSRGIPTDNPNVVKDIRRSVQDAETTIRKGFTEPITETAKVLQSGSQKLGENIVEGGKKLIDEYGSVSKIYDKTKELVDGESPTDMDMEANYIKEAFGDGLMNIKKAENVKKADNKVKEKIKKDINKNLKKKVEEKPTNYFSRHRTEAAKVVEEAIPEITIKRFRDAYKPEEKEKIIKEEENKVVAIEDKKQIRASIKEQGPDKYYVDPLTGYALNLTKLSKRASAMQVANMLPAADRAVYLFSQEVIDKEDFDTMMGPGSRASLDLKLKRMQIERANYEIIAAKKKAEKDPKRAEYLSMFTNAMSNKNFGLVSYLGEKLGLEKNIMDRAEKSFKEYELDKLRSKSTGGGLEKGFKSDFAVPYSNVVNNKVKWVNYATSLIQTSGQFAEIMDINGNIKTVDRSAKFRSYGLYEQDKMKNKTHAEQIKIFNRSPYRKALMTNKNYHNKKGEFDPSILVNDKDAYEQYLLNDLVWMGLDDVYNEQYGEMVKWITKNSYNHEKEMARINKLLTAGATVNEKGEVKQNRIISN